VSGPDVFDGALESVDRRAMVSDFLGKRTTIDAGTGASRRSSPLHWAPLISGPAAARGA
jgi:hypothetical protein